jgi:hypothetical protein
MRTWTVSDKIKDLATIPWEQRPLLPLPTAAEVLGCSVSQVYSLGHRGEIELVTVAGRTQARTPSIIRLINQATPWVSASHRTAQAVAARTVQRQQDGSLLPPLAGRLGRRSTAEATNQKHNAARGN